MVVYEPTWSGMGQYVATAATHAGQDGSLFHKNTLK